MDSNDSKVLPLVLLILDGYGLAEVTPGNAIKAASTPNLDAIFATYPWVRLKASGHDVGLPTGQMGNSEVGHMTIGSGRIILQDLERINQAINSGEFATSSALITFIAIAQSRAQNIHIIGLLSDGGVHSHENHFFEIIKILSKTNLTIHLHLFLDGRDTMPGQGALSLEKLQHLIIGKPNIHISTIMGRFWGMDRSQNWDRIQIAYNAIVFAFGKTLDFSSTDFHQILEVGEEHLKPLVNTIYKGVQTEDAIIFTNFRSDRMRQICTALVDPDFNHFPRPWFCRQNLSMTSYSLELEKLCTPIFSRHITPNTLGEILSDAGLRQVRLAETEKYAHVTYFFDGGAERNILNCKSILIPSLIVSDYSTNPEMSVDKITDALIENLSEADIFIVNFANLDMVGHTGNFAATVKAVEKIDQAVGKVYNAIQKLQGTLIVTSDHGNAEEMLDSKTGKPSTTHTLNDVPFLVTFKDFEYGSKENLGLKDSASFILKLLKLKDLR